LGYYAGSINALFVGVMLPFTDHFHVLVEHNGRRITAGMEFRLHSPLAFRLLFREQDTLLSASYSFKF
jgi:hypothetical protein